MSDRDSWKIRRGKKVTFELSECSYGLIRSLVRYGLNAKVEYHAHPLVMAQSAIKEKDSVLAMISSELDRAERKETC